VLGSLDREAQWARTPYRKMQQVYMGPSVSRLAGFGAQAEGVSERAGQNWE